MRERVRKVKRECDRFEESIWDHARTGAELTEEAARHLSSCPNCRRALEDAKKLSALLVEAGRVVHTPDCRRTVMARISAEPRRQVTFGWAYGLACACAIALLGAVAVLLAPSREPHKSAQAPLAVKKSASAKSGPAPMFPPTAVKKQIPPKQEVAVRPARTSKRAVQKVRVSMVRRLRGPRRAVVRAGEAVSSDRVSRADIQPNSSNVQSATTGTRPIAAVYVTWPQPGESDDASYHYVEHNAETNETTTCWVKRSGDRIEIHMESKSGGSEPPVKGSIEHDENTSNA